MEPSGEGRGSSGIQLPGHKPNQAWLSDPICQRWLWGTVASARNQHGVDEPVVFLRGAVPKGLMFPVSAAMLLNPALYDRALEAFSEPLMRLVEYELDDLVR